MNQVGLSWGYDWRQVVLSIVIAMAAAHVTLDAANLVTASRGRRRHFWLASGAAAMGLGIWAMHYVGMMAVMLPIPVAYHLATVTLSLLAAMLASALALWMVSRETMSRRNAILAAVVMGSGIATMHYVGMAAMRVQATVHYLPATVIGSILVAIGVSLIALWRAFVLRRDTGSGWSRQKLVSAVLMGAAIPAMHYTAMVGVRFLPTASAPSTTGAIGITTLGYATIVVATLSLLLLTVGIAAINRKFQQHEAAIEEQDARFRTLVEQSGDAITILDARGRVTLATGAIESVLGYRPEELLGRNVFEFLPPKEGLLQRERVRQLRDHPETVVQMEGSFQRKDGAWRIGRGSLTNRMHVPAVRGLVLTFWDATEQVHLEEQLRLGQRLESVGMLAGGIAHDFNNLLTTIAGNVDLLIEQTPQDSPPRTELVEVRNAAARASGLTRQLLAFSRKQVLQPRQVNLNELVRSREEVLARAVSRTGVRLELELAADPGWVKADPNQLEQVLLALVRNAAAACPGEGTITVSTSEASFAERHVSENGTLEPGEYVMLAVHDTGVGMSADTVKHIFDPFFTTRTTGEGTGLGLAMVHGIVHQSGGHIWVYSEPGLGTSFKLYFPGSSPRAQTAEHPVPAMSRKGHERILVAEDELSVQRLTRKVLERQGYEVWTAADGIEALALAERSPARIDLLVTDVIMPNMGGRELAERLAASHPESRVLFVSGYSGEAISRQGILEPGFAFLEKPFTADALAHKVRDVLDGPLAPRSTA